MPDESQKCVSVMSAMTTATPGRKAASRSVPRPAALVMSTSGGNVTISGTTSGLAVLWQESGFTRSPPHRVACLALASDTHFAELAGVWSGVDKHDCDSANLPCPAAAYGAVVGGWHLAWPLGRGFD